MANTLNTGTKYLPGGGTGKILQFFGIYLGYIAVNQDPLAQGRCKLRVPQVFGNSASTWADPVVPLEYVPEVGTAVAVMFLGGDPTRPVYLGNFAIPSGGGVKVTISSTAPSSPNVGDIWYDSANGNAMNEWNGDQWVTYQIGSDALADGAVQNANLAPGAVATTNIQDGAVGTGQLSSDVTARTLGGNIVTIGEVQPTNAIDGDTWIETNSDNDITSIWAYNGTEWIESTIAISTGGGNTITASDTQPTSPNTGDLWVDEDQDNTLYIYNGSSWVAYQLGTEAIADGAVTSAQISPTAGITSGQVSFTAADIGGVSIFVQSTQPTANNDGDLWYDTANGNALYQWNGTTWTPYQYGTDAISDNAITTALIDTGAVTAAQVLDNTLTSAQIAADAAILGSQLAADAGITAGQVSFTAADIGGVQITLGSTQPSSPNSGDLWYDGANGNQLYEYNGTTWVAYQYGTNAIADNAITTALIDSGAVTAEQIQDGAVSSAQIADDAAILGTQLANGTISLTQINTTDVTARTLGGNIVSIGETEPSNPISGDTWVETNSSNEITAIQTYNGTEWVESTIAISTGGGNTITASDTQPTSGVTGDLWVDEDNGNALYIYNGTTWEPYQLGTAAIADSAITSAQIAPAGIQPSNIASLTASLIGQLGVINANPYFTGGDDTGWTVTGGTMSVTSSPPSGAPYGYAAEYVNGASAHGGIVSPSFPVIAGNQYQGTAWVYNTGTGATGAIRFEWAWSDGTTFLTDTILAETVTVGTWTQITAVVTAPSTATQSTLEVGTTNADGSTVYVQAVLVMPQVPGSLVEAGTVTATQIEAGTITSAQLDVADVQANVVQTADLSASQITTGTLSGQEIEVYGTTNGMYLYNGTPAAGNIPVAWMSMASTDPYGNAVPAPGIGATQGTITGLEINAGSISGSTIAGSIFQGSGFDINNDGIFFYESTLDVTVSFTLATSADWGLDSFVFSNVGANPTAAQAGYSNPTSVESFTVTMNYGAKQVAAGDLIYVQFMTTVSQSSGSFTVTDSEGNTYTGIGIGNPIDGDAFYQWTFLGTATKALTSTSTVTVTGTVSANFSCSVYGLHDFGTYVAGWASSGSGASISSTVVDVPSNGIVIAQAWAVNQKPSTPTGFTLIGTNSGNTFNSTISYSVIDNSASGNLGISITTASGTDASGNAYKEGITVYQDGGGYITMSPYGTEALLALAPEFTNPSNYAVTVPQMVTAAFESGAAEYFVYALYSGQLGASPNALLQLYGGSEDGTTSIPHVSISGGSSGTMIIDINETGIHAANPAEANSDEIWHTMAGFSTGYSHGSSPAPSYKLMPDNTVAFTGQVTAAATAGTTVCSAFGSTPYYPLTTKKFIVPTTSATYLYVELTITTSGELEMSGGPVGNVAFTANIDVRYPLDL